MSTAVVLDCGSSLMRAGFAGDESPRVVFPTVVGHPRCDIPFPLGKDSYVGSEVQSMRLLVSRSQPVRRGRVTNWDDMEKIWHHTFYNELGVTPEEHSVLLTETPLNPKGDRQRMAQIMFETFNIPALYLAIQAVLSLYASGRKTGIVLDSGDGTSHIVPVNEGYWRTTDIVTFPIAGSDLTDYLVNMLTRLGYGFNTVHERQVAQDMKEQLCYVALDYEEELVTGPSWPHCWSDNFYLVPDGQEIKVTNERFHCPEVMFQPSMFGVGAKGVHHTIYKCIMKYDADLRKELFNNIVLAGGTTVLPGFAERLKKELNALIPLGVNVNVVSPPKRQNSAWTGGSMMAAHPSFNNSCITKEQYYEFGSSIVDTEF